MRKLKEQVSGEEFGKAQLQYWNKPENSRKLDRLIRLEIAKELDVSPETTFEENKEFAEKFIKRRGEVMKEIEQYELDHELDLGPFMILRKDKSKMYFKPIVRKKNKIKEMPTNNILFLDFLVFLKFNNKLWKKQNL